MYIVVVGRGTLKKKMFSSNHRSVRGNWYIFECNFGTVLLPIFNGSFKSTINTFSMQSIVNTLTFEMYDYKKYNAYDCKLHFTFWTKYVVLSRSGEAIYFPFHKYISKSFFTLTYYWSPPSSDSVYESYSFWRLLSYIHTTFCIVFYDFAYVSKMNIWGNNYIQVQKNFCALWK